MTFAWNPLKLKLDGLEIFLPLYALPASMNLNNRKSSIPEFYIDRSDTCKKIATIVNDVGSKFATSLNNAGVELPPVSTTLLFNRDNNIRLQTHWHKFYISKINL